MMLTKISAANLAIAATGASTVTSNIASYFTEYQSMFTVSVSIITCIGFIISVGWGMWLKHAEQKETKRHHAAIESKSG